MIDPILLQDAIAAPLPVMFVLAMSMLGVCVGIAGAFMWFLRGSNSAGGI